MTPIDQNRSGMRRGAHSARSLPVLLFSIALAACGTTLVTIRIDIGSFLSADESSIDYGTDPVIPGNGPTVEIRTPVEIIPTPEEINQVTQIEAVEIRALAEFRNDTGTATVSYRIFFDHTEDHIFDTTPVVDERVDLGPGSTSQTEILIEGDYRLMDLFEGDEIAFASEIEVIPGEDEENIAGRVELIELTAQITAARETE